MYQVSFTTEGKEKFISIRNSDTGQFFRFFREVDRFYQYILE